MRIRLNGCSRNPASWPTQPLAPDRTVSARRRDRRDGAHRGAASLRGARPVGGGRQSRRRERHRRRRSGRKGRTRRLHAHHGQHLDARDQRRDFRQAALRSAEELRAGDDGGDPAVAGRGASLGAGEDDAGAGGAGEGQARRARLRHGRQLDPSRGRAVLDGRRHQDEPHPLQGQRAGDQRPGRRPDPGAVRSRSRRSIRRSPPAKYARSR